MISGEASSTYIVALRQLIREYDAITDELMSFDWYVDNRKIQALKERKDKLLALAPGEVLKEED